MSRGCHPAAHAHAGRFAADAYSDEVPKRLTSP
jgi:hypothetical protein